MRHKIENNKYYYAYPYTNIQGKSDGISSTEFNKKLASLKAKDIAVVMDFCYSGGFVEKKYKKYMVFHFMSIR